MGSNYIEFTPKKSTEVTATFTSKSILESATNKSNTNIDSSVSTNSVAPASLDSSFNNVSSVMFSETFVEGKSGQNQKYDYLKYLINSQTGNYLVITNTQGKHCLYLYSKLGEELSRVILPNDLPTVTDESKDKYLYITKEGYLTWHSIKDYTAGLAISIKPSGLIELLYDDSLFQITADNKLAFRMEVLDAKFASKSDLDAKQNKLASQLAYTKAGSSKLVPQITTNNIGQVTNITEIAIDAGVTSITAGNGLTGGTITATGKLEVDKTVVAFKEDLKITAADTKVPW